ncbi:MAG: S9 family peptidase [Firmicutes bacterium]|nr:S9 family peptidase [Bacillota bacterium]
MTEDKSPAEEGLFSLGQIAGSGSVLSFDWSPQGDSLAIAWKRDGISQLYLLKREAACPRLLTTNGIAGSAKGDGGPVWSPDGEWLAYVSLTAGYRNLWLAQAAGGPGRQLTNGPHNDYFPCWSPGGHYLAFVTDRWGDESLVLMERGGRAFFRLTEKVSVSEPAWSPNGRQIAVVVSQESRPGSSALALVSFPEKDPESVFSPAGSAGPSRFLDEPIFPAKTWRYLTALDGARVWSPCWSPDGRRIAFISDRSGFAEIWEVSLPEGQTHPLLENGREEEWLAWSPGGSELAFVENENGSLGLALFDRNTGDIKFVRRGPQVISRPRWSSDGEKLAYLEERHDSPPELYLARRDEKDWSWQRLTWSTPLGLEPAMGAGPQEVHYQSFDGLEINARLYRPSLPDPRPALVYLHGGPSSQFTNGWSPFLQYLASRGYVVLAPNYRGSTGYGRAFQELNDGDWGGNDLQDVVFAARYLQAQEFVDPKRIGVYGGSYGGYLTLLALAKAPGVFRLGIDLYGVSNRLTAWLETDKVGRLNMLKEMGSPATQRELYQDRSAINFVSQIDAPLLILHGEQDKRVPPAQSAEIAEALRRHDKLFFYHTYPGEGHGFEKPENLLDSYRRIEQFLVTFL